MKGEGKKGEKWEVGSRSGGVGAKEKEKVKGKSEAMKKRDTREMVLGLKNKL